jgi:hypothetical protein
MVGNPDQLAALAPVVRIKRDANAGRHLDRGVAHEIRHAQSCEDLFGRRNSALPALEFGQQDHELVSAIAAGRVRRAQAGGQTCRDLLQYPVSSDVTELVIDALEVVQVKKQQRDLPAPPPCQRDRLAEAVLQQSAIRQAGQLVVKR